MASKNEDLNENENFEEGQQLEKMSQEMNYDDLTVNGTKDESKAAECARMLEIIEKNKHYLIAISKEIQNGDRKLGIGEERDLGDLITKEWEKDKKTGDLIYKNQSVLGSQVKLVSYMIKKIGKNLFSGISLTRISLPVMLFKDMTFLQT